MNIKNILKGKDRRAQYSLDQLQLQVGENPNILWYPSADEDFRDVIEGHRTPIKPDLYFHTEVQSKSEYRDMKLDRHKIFNYDDTSIMIKNVQELEFVDEINYNVSSDYVYEAWINNANYKNYEIQLLEMVSDSKNGRKISWVIYFKMENINFLEEVLLKNKIKISHLVKVRHAGSFSINTIFTFFSELNIKYFFSDYNGDIYADFNDNFDRITKENDIDFKNFSLVDIGEKGYIPDWSKTFVKTFKVNYNDTPMTYKSLKEAIEIISPI